jgi:hypothetical protein
MLAYIVNEFLLCFEFLCSLLMTYWLGLCVLRRTCRQNRLYETLFHTVIILSKHHHHHHHHHIVNHFFFFRKMALNAPKRIKKIENSLEKHEADMEVYICIYMFIYICLCLYNSMYKVKFIYMYIYMYIYIYIGH